MRFVRIGLVLGLALAACGGDDAADTTTTEPTVTSEPSSGTTAPPGETTTTAATTTAPTTEPSTTTPTTTAPVAPSTTPPTTPPTALADVKVYFLRGERLVVEHRDVPGPAVLRGAIEELLAGPTDAEISDGVFTIVPDGTTLLDVNLVDGLATVDLSREFESGGGSLSMMARVGQVVFTATQFPNVDQVRFWLDGEAIDYLGGEGLVMSEPWTRPMVGRDLSGSVIIDTPRHGATVTSPFTVTGEGDVFEAQFPIEIWRDGAQIGGIAPVTAGAWGAWATFEVTITVDAAPGPIELVAYDEGGCGTGPECPEIVKTVVPLVLAG